MDVALANLGPATLVDLYMGIRLPVELGPVGTCAAGDAAVFLADGFARIGIACLSGPAAALPPLARGVPLPAGLPQTSFEGVLSFVWPAGLPAATYPIFIAFTLADAFRSANPADPAVVVAFGVDSVVYDPTAVTSTAASVD